MRERDSRDRGRTRDKEERRDGERRRDRQRMGKREIWKDRGRLMRKKSKKETYSLFIIVFHLDLYNIDIERERERERERGLTCASWDPACCACARCCRTDGS